MAIVYYEWSFVDMVFNDHDHDTPGGPLTISINQNIRPFQQSIIAF